MKVVIPVTFADIDGTRWSYCDTKLRRIQYKKSIADAAVDGAVPEGNLRSPAQAQRDILVWLERLESGRASTVSRRKIVVPLSDDVSDVRRRLAKYGDFSKLNNRWNSSRSDALGQRLRANPEEWEQYHTLYREARSQWAVVPVEEMIKWCKKLEGYSIGDFGCGEALLAKAISDRHTVQSFDHIAVDGTVIEGDMSHVPLDDNSLDVGVFALSLMGVNFIDYIREAHRVLKIDGHLHIWEATSRFEDVRGFCRDLERLGFRTFPPQARGPFTYIEAQKCDYPAVDRVTLRFARGTLCGRSAFLEVLVKKCQMSVFPSQRLRSMTAWTTMSIITSCPCAAGWRTQNKRTVKQGVTEHWSSREKRTPEKPKQQ